MLIVCIDDAICYHCSYKNPEKYILNVNLAKIFDSRARASRRDIREFYRDSDGANSHSKSCVAVHSIHHRE